MPVVPKGSKILITSGSGFIGSWTVNIALREGFKVKTTVRSAAKGDYLQQLFDAKYGKGKFEYAIVEDLEKQGAFDPLVAGTNELAASLC